MISPLLRRVHLDAKNARRDLPFQRISQTTAESGSLQKYQQEEKKRGKLDFKTQ